MPKKNFKHLAEKIFKKVFFGIEKPHLINIRHEHSNYFENEIFLEEDLNEIKRLIFEKTNVFFKSQQYPIPFYESIENPYLLLTWFHPRYNEYSDVTAPKNSFFEIIKWIHNCDGNEFLLACSAFFASLNCQKIFITDKTNDGGVDLIALKSWNNQIPTLFLIQAKTLQKNSQISRELLLQELGKYYNLPQKEVYKDYFSPVERNLNGCSFAHVFMSNCGLRDDAMKEAFYGKSVFINDLRISFALSEHFSLTQIKKVGERIKNERNSLKFEYDLQYNLANKFNEVLSVS